jgi:O-methyltransferase
MTKDFLPKIPNLDMNRVLNFESKWYWGVKDKDKEKFDSLIQELKKIIIPGVYIGDSFISWIKNNSFLEDPIFVEAFKKNILNHSDEGIAWRRYILACSAFHCVNLEGDFAEFGTWAGTGIKTVIDYLGGRNFPKKFWGYDTFDYNPVDGHHFEGQEDGFYKKVLDRFRDYSQVHLIKGFLPESLSLGKPEKLAYMHIDLNNSEGEIAVLDIFFDKLVKGGIVILDDYETSGAYRKQKKEEDKWFQKRGYRVFPLPTGQGMVIKR